MDSLSQAALGAAVGEAILGKKIGRKAAILGAIGGTIPDLDVFLLPFFNNLQRISIHRGFSHSILFCVLAGVLFTFVLSKIKWTNQIHLFRLFLFSFLALFTHVLLDAFTTYGTQLYLPFSSQRVGFDSVNIVDPLYTLPLLIGLLLSIFYFKNSEQKRRLANNLGLIISSAYLIFTLINKHQVENEISTQLKNKNIEFTQLLTVPIKLANINWYGVAKDDNNVYLGKYNVLKKNAIEFSKFPINDFLLDKVDPEVANQMKWFAKGFYVVDSLNSKLQFYNLQCDMQGVINNDTLRAPTVFYFEIDPKKEASKQLKTSFHKQ